MVTGNPSSAARGRSGPAEVSLAGGGRGRRAASLVVPPAGGSDRLSGASRSMPPDQARNAASRASGSFTSGNTGPSDRGSGGQPARRVTSGADAAHAARRMSDFTHYHIQGIFAATAGPLTGLCTETASLLVR